MCEVGVLDIKKYTDERREMSYCTLNRGGTQMYMFSNDFFRRPVDKFICSAVIYKYVFFLRHVIGRLFLCEIARAYSGKIKKKHILSLY